MAAAIAYLNGDYVDPSRLTIAMNDMGFLMGTTVSERVRTFQGNLFRWEAHLDRLARSLQVIDVELPDYRSLLTAAVEKVVEHNYRLLDPADDLGLCILITPGELAAADAHEETQPTVCVYSYPLPFRDWVPWYTDGVPLMVSQVRQVPANCWPGDLKCRSRMHYYLADQEVAREQPGARALLLDQEGYVSEASTANVVTFRSSEGLVTPPRLKTLPGISLAVVRELAEQLSMNWVERDLTVDDMAEAEEIMLCSTSPCIWAVTEFNCQPVGDGKPGVTWKTLLARWSDMVGVSIRQQAEQFAQRGIG
ncbi:MAG: aminotransferase class IV [Pirellulaceae bacterium]